MSEDDKKRVEKTEGKVVCLLHQKVVFFACVIKQIILAFFNRMLIRFLDHMHCKKADKKPLNSGLAISFRLCSVSIVVCKRAPPSVILGLQRNNIFPSSCTLREVEYPYLYLCNHNRQTPLDLLRSISALNHFHRLFNRNSIKSIGNDLMKSRLRHSCARKEENKANTTNVE